MKKVILIMMGLTGFAIGSPAELQRLKEQRDAAVERIDVVYKQELNKLRREYNAANDLESLKAVNIALGIETPESDSSGQSGKTVTYLFDKKSSDTDEWLIVLRPDGTFRHLPRPNRVIQGTWKKGEDKDDPIVLVLNGKREPYLMITLRGLSRDRAELDIPGNVTKTDRRGKLVANPR